MSTDIFTDCACVGLADQVFSAQTTITVDGTAGFPDLTDPALAGRTFLIEVKNCSSGTFETMRVTATNGNVFSVTRAVGFNQIALDFCPGDQVCTIFGSTLSEALNEIIDCIPVVPPGAGECNCVIQPMDNDPAVACIDVVETVPGTFELQSLITVVPNAAIVNNPVDVIRVGCEFRVSVATAAYIDSAAACAADPGNPALLVTEQDLFTWKHAFMHTDPADTGSVTHPCWNIALGTQASQAVGTLNSVISTTNVQATGVRTNGLASFNSTVSTAQNGAAVASSGVTVAGLQENGTLATNGTVIDNTRNSSAVASISGDLTGTGFGLFAGGAFNPQMQGTGNYNAIVGSVNVTIDSDAGGANMIGGSGAASVINGTIASIIGSSDVTISATSSRGVIMSSLGGSVLNGANSAIISSTQATTVNGGVSTAISSENLIIDADASVGMGVLNGTLAGARNGFFQVNNVSTGANTSFSVAIAGSNLNTATPVINLDAAFSAAIAFEDSTVAADVSAVLAGNDNLVSAASVRGTVIPSSAFVASKNTDNYSLVGGFAVAGPAAAANQTWKIDSKTGDFYSVAAFNVVGAIPGFGEIHKNEVEEIIPLGSMITYGEGNTVRVAQPGDVAFGVASDTIVFLAGSVDEEDFNEDGRLGSNESRDPHKYTDVEWTGRTYVNVSPSVAVGDYIIPGLDGVGVSGGKPGSGWRVLEKSDEFRALVAIKGEAFA